MVQNGMYAFSVLVFVLVSSGTLKKRDDSTNISYIYLTTEFSFLSISAAVSVHGAHVEKAKLKVACLGCVTRVYSMHRSRGRLDYIGPGYYL